MDAANGCNWPPLDGTVSISVRAQGFSVRASCGLCRTCLLCSAVPISPPSVFSSWSFTGTSQEVGAEKSTFFVPFVQLEWVKPQMCGHVGPRQHPGGRLQPSCLSNCPMTESGTSQMSTLGKKIPKIPHSGQNSSNASSLNDLLLDLMGSEERAEPELNLRATRAG